ncbi:conserved Plasmodium protein, unknown function [Plasmodium knowlesi strain H]|uniref:Secreted protein n=3 Tax=Plasmodium knowlesi TaxID=5850 RepID=A0A5E7WZQ3_PLAKH|nr:conserved Plasmodium protein, unknown function [Plasmodium knowlesi strain H]OTN65987.1 Uncharacterized protein PKNOH_S100032900 [Plasmodium knowlesi]CAA9987694.1 conserved Plasmodium protein, unknown function [Plasmodium knowlesi strain H]SBO26913.1 conserved Plasmodium protein, unknown function [Plasmodium knowlesi strain H]SBO29628.1 conserved Plasmodium protein, unknown function [Plasmodium knowlesi strain H]VVS77168.1 conserved Plasmodium protein, unknown function [Plasmodium knowlesi 
MNGPILKILLFAVLCQCVVSFLKGGEGPSLASGENHQPGDLNIGLSYDDKKQKAFKLQLKGETGVVDAPLIILQPTEDVPPGELYKKYLDEVDDPSNISVIDVLRNLVDSFEPIEQKRFLDRFLDEVDAHVKFYESFSAE